jgi:hypothetical protein
MNFRLNKQAREIQEALSSEYLSILAILYGDQIESGIKRISDYGTLTMLDAENELRIRMMMMKGQRMRKKRELKEEHEAQEQAMLEQLKRTQQ